MSQEAEMNEECDREDLSIYIYSGLSCMQKCEEEDQTRQIRVEK